MKRKEKERDRKRDPRGREAAVRVTEGTTPVRGTRTKIVLEPRERERKEESESEGVS